ncbi:MAG TPA: winged helix-turn-helix domain-containing protein [Pyrinomonadaceae bacterium]|nr:winged helix-turn-helix domain-containing protein [Pyrinomonadaceae bacterium]
MAIDPTNPSSYSFGDFRIDALERVLVRNGELVPLTAKVFDLLLLLVENHGHVVEKDRLMKEVWPDTFVEEGNLTQNISVLRKALGNSHNGNQYIQTIPRRGYRFVGKVRPEASDSEDLLIEEHLRARIVFSETETQPIPALVPGPRGISRAQRNVLIAGAGLAVVVLAAVFGNSWRKAEPANSAAAPASIRTIAVLPFKPLSNEGREEYLELGIADSLITRLSSIRQIVVRPTSSVRRFAGTNYDPIAAGRELKTDAVVDGSIQRLGDRLRINVQLIRISDGSVLWGYHCDDLCTDLFTAQDSISENVARSLALTLSDVENQELTKHYTTSSDALRAYLNARYYYGRRTKEAGTKTVEYLQKAVALDPQYSLAYAALAEAYASLAFLKLAGTAESMTKARAAAETSLQLDPNLAEAHSADGFIKLTYDWDWRGADQEFQKALELDPNGSAVHDEYATLLEAQGRMDEAIVEVNKARELDPLSLLVSRNQGRAYYYARQYDRAAQIWQETAEMDRSFPAVNNWLTWVYEAEGKYREAIDSHLQQEALSGVNADSLQSLRQAYDAGGWNAYWQKDLQLHQEQLNDPLGDRYEMVQLYRRLGRTDEAFKWLNKACDDRSVWMIWLKVDPALDGLRSDPRFAQLVKRVGLS